MPEARDDPQASCTENDNVYQLGEHGATPWPPNPTLVATIPPAKTATAITGTQLWEGLKLSRGTCASLFFYFYYYNIIYI